MVSNDSTVDSTLRFARFDVHDFTYKTVNHYEIRASVLIPKNLSPGSHPVIVRWHGGGFVTGHRLYPDWFPSYITAYALQQSAILICPDYRLMPEATGFDILEDVRDFWAALFSPDLLYNLLPTGISADLTRTLVCGESAGGWLSLMSGFLYPEQIRAVLAQYPMIDMKDEFYATPQLFASSDDLPNVSVSVWDEYVSALSPNAVRASSTPPDRLSLTLSMLRNGRLLTHFGNRGDLFPLELIEKGSRIPPLWILHGLDDPLVPCDGTRKFVALMQKRLPHVPLHITYRPGSHGFDNTAQLTDDWVALGLSFIEKFWLD